MSGRSQFPPLSRAAAIGTAPAQCAHCKTQFVATTWPKSKWTLSGWSPWCAECDALYARHKPVKRKPGPKPKYAVKGGWTNLPIN